MSASGDSSRSSGYTLVNQPTVSFVSRCANNASRPCPSICRHSVRPPLHRWYARNSADSKSSFTCVRYALLHSPSNRLVSSASSWN